MEEQQETPRGVADEKQNMTLEDVRITVGKHGVITIGLTQLIAVVIGFYALWNKIDDFQLHQINDFTYPEMQRWCLTEKFDVRNVKDIHEDYLQQLGLP